MSHFIFFAFLQSPSKIHERKEKNGKNINSAEDKLIMKKDFSGETFSFPSRARNDSAVKKFNKSSHLHKSSWHFLLIFLNFFEPSLANNYLIYHNQNEFGWRKTL